MDIIEGELMIVSEKICALGFGSVGQQSLTAITDAALQSPK